MVVAGHPFRERGPGDTSFDGYVGFGSASADDTGDEAVSSGRSQWGVSVGHETGLLLDEVGC